MLTFFVYILYIPFGYWRTNVERFSPQWFLAIHLPVPFIILPRIYSHTGFEFYTYPLMILSFSIGLFFGSKIYLRNLSVNFKPVTSCLVMDIYRSFRS